MKVRAMDFRLTEEQIELVAAAHRFGTSVFMRRNMGRWRKTKGLPDEVVKGFADLFFSDDAALASRGNGNYSLLDKALIVEELSRCAGCSLPFQNDLFNMEIMEEFADAENFKTTMEEYRRTGRLMFALAVSEPGAGSDLKNLKTYTKTVNGKVLLNGMKTYVDNGEYAPYIVVAAIDEDCASDDRHPSLGFWFLPRTLKGIKAVPISKVGQEMLPFASLSFKDVALDQSYRLPGGSFPHLYKMLEFGRVFICASSLGMAQAAMDDAVAYAAQRDQFGQRICEFQQIQEMLTDMEVSLTNMRLLLYRAAWEIDVKGEDRRLAAALLKRYVPKAATEVASNAIQIMGGKGYTDAERVGQIWQDCRGNQIAEGTDQIMCYIAAPLIMNKYGV
jgi:alkylation response protein AidB-like acyl-CoA dehydrogenase